jgi:hypothetical protein
MQLRINETATTPHPIRLTADLPNCLRNTPLIKNPNNGNNGTKYAILIKVKKSKIKKINNRFYSLSTTGKE